MFTVLMSRDTVKRLASIKKVKGLIFTAKDFDIMNLLKKDLGGNFIVYSCSDKVATLGLLSEDDGIIGSFYNLISETFIEINKRAKASDFKGLLKFKKLQLI